MIYSRNFPSFSVTALNARITIATMRNTYKDNKLRVENAIRTLQRDRISRIERRNGNSSIDIDCQNVFLAQRPSWKDD
jgi:hypothetical protein